MNESDGLVQVPARDADYAAWVRQHPDGYVIHLRKAGAGDACWHRADCGHIQPDGTLRFVESNAIKACSLNPGALAAWAVSTYPSKRLHYCEPCRDKWLKEQRA